MTNKYFTKFGSIALITTLSLIPVSMVQATQVSQPKPEATLQPQVDTLANYYAGLYIERTDKDYLKPQTSPQVRASKQVRLGGGSGSSSATLGRDGTLRVEGSTISNSWVTGTAAQTYVVGRDERGREIFVSSMFAIPTACSRSDWCPSYQTKTFLQRIDSNVAKYVHTMDVYVENRGTPNSIQRIKSNIKKACSEYKDLPMSVRMGIAYGTDGISEGACQLGSQL